MRSMTGYGTGDFEWKKKKIHLEVKTVNHRFCEVNLRIPPRYSILELELQDFSKKNFERGRIDIFIREQNASSVKKIIVDEDQLQRYLKMIQQLSKKYGLSKEVPAERFFSFPGVVSVEEEPETEISLLLPELKKNLEKVFQKVKKLREKEGEGIKKDFFNRLDFIEKNILAVEKQIPGVISLYKTRLQERIEKMLKNSVEESRLAQEVAYFVDRSDTSEEIQRLKSHISHFREVFKEKDAIGRKLDFILQEIHRELNTLGSKAQDSEISRWIVASKHELEKMREQVQNVE
ncbi:MAG: YicC family protein [Deltaproteobacteria bacterium]|nr:YicC family protein [Deltaproteobacteria bacterium]